MGWEPIETKPRYGDGCYLAWCPDAGDGYGAWLVVHTPRKRTRSDPTVTTIITGRNFKASHWMPLPAPPSDTPA